MPGIVIFSPPLLMPPVFVLERPRSRLAGEYRSLVRALQIENCEDLRNVTCGIALHNERAQRVIFFHTFYHSGFTFDGSRLTKPGKCPSCRGTRLFEPQIVVHPPAT